MNNERRKAIKALYAQVDSLKPYAEAWAAAKTALEEAAENLKNDIESIRDEEQEYIDNLPENLQGSEKAQNAEAAVSQLDEALGQLEDIDIEQFDADSITSALDEATA